MKCTVIQMCIMCHNSSYNTQRFLHKDSFLNSEPKKSPQKYIYCKMEVFFAAMPTKVLVFMFPFTPWCLSCCQGGWNLWGWIFREIHLQVLLLSGEGVGEALHRLRFVFCYFWLDGLRYFLNYRINLFQETMGLVDLIHLRGQREKKNPVKLYSFLVIHRTE